MPAQNGASVVLAYGPQGAQQLGSAVVLQAAAAVTSRLVVSRTRAPWQRAASLEQPVHAPYEVAAKTDRTSAAPWLSGIALNRDDQSRWSVAAATDDHVRAPWIAYLGRAQPASGAAWGVAVRADDRAAAPWGSYEALRRLEYLAAWGVSLRADERLGAPWGGPAQAVDLTQRAAFALSRAVDMRDQIAWGRYSTLLNPTTGIVIPVHTGDLEALFVVPVQKFYMQVNTTSLRRVDTDTQLPTFSLSLSLDSGSWVWSFNASLPADQLSLVEPVDGAPVELEAMVNGTAFRLLVDSIGRSREFGKQTINLAGRGKAALLDAPYSPIYQFSNASGARTAQQLIVDALGKNAFGATWSIDWHALDWLVPTGVWSYSGSQMDAINTIARAAGLYVQPHTSNLSLSVLAQYPVAPWDWADVAPDYELPVDVVTRESIDWADKPAYNRVFVSGTHDGVLGQVTRNGTAGDVLAPMVTDALITHADAARQRGNMILSDTGRIANVSLRLPVLDLTGVILPGSFVRYIDGGTTRLGIVRSTALEVSMPTVWQTIGVETHVN